MLPGDGGAQYPLLAQPGRQRNINRVDILRSQQRLVRPERLRRTLHRLFRLAFFNKPPAPFRIPAGDRGHNPVPRISNRSPVLPRNLRSAENAPTHLFLFHQIDNDSLRILTALCLFCVLSLGAADGPHFAVVSIRQAPDETPFFAKPPSNGAFSATGIVARFMVMLAWNVEESQITDAPQWFATERWNVQAKSEPGTYTPEQTQAMLQNMLHDRFALQTHRETRERPAYLLTVAKGGSKLKADDTGSTNVRVSSNSISLERGDIARLTQLLASALGRPVVDRTGLTGHYDLLLQWDDAPVPDGGVIGLGAQSIPDPNRGSIFSAIQNQLGLHLESRTAPVEMLVIDKIERPSEN